MKGTFFQKPLEFGLRIDGESWNQGDTISGELTIKNQGSEKSALHDVRVSLGYGDLKKVRAKEEGCFDILSQTSLDRTAQLEPQKTLQHPWSFKLDRNAPITDGSSSLFITYGMGAALEKIGQLQLIVKPDKIVQEYLGVLQTDFRWVLRIQKMNKGRLEIKLVPPASRSFATVEHVFLSFFLNGETLETQYLFHVKKLEASAAAIEMKKDKKQVNQSIGPDVYLLPSGRFNHEKIALLIAEALSQVESITLN